jgi:hypothetical protein
MAHISVVNGGRFGGASQKKAPLSSVTLADSPFEYACGEVKGIQTRYVAGLDLGQKRDYSALAVVERRTIVYSGRNAMTFEPLQRVEYTMTHLERMPLHLLYPEIVERVRDRMMLIPPCEGLSLVVDATGVGPPVVDLLRMRGLGRGLMPVTITGGMSANGSAREGYRVPKRDLITGLQVAFETRTLGIAGGLGGMVEALIEELTEMRCEVSETGHEKFGVWREGLHDDLVLATSLGWWGMRQKETPGIWGTRRLL